MTTTEHGLTELGGYTEQQAAKLRAAPEYAELRAAYETDLNEGRLFQTVDRTLGMTCGRCASRTGNNTQGHYWAYCRVTQTLGPPHFCCSDACELEVGLEAGEAQS